MTMFISSFSRYTFNKSSVGAKNPLDEFQWAMCEKFDDMKNVPDFSEDMIVYRFKEDGSGHKYMLNEFL